MDDLRGALAKLAEAPPFVSDWREVTQADIDRFADATDDHQWVHVDRERAARELPGGRTIAHGYLTLSLIPSLTSGSRTLEGVGMMLNYGLDRVRFVAPVPNGARVRGRSAFAGVEETSRGLLASWDVTIELEGSEKPACVARTLALIIPA